MRGTWLVLRAETYRLLCTRGAWLGLVFLASVSALRVVAGRAGEAIERVGSLTQGNQVSEALESGGAGWAALVDGWRTGLSASTLLLLLFAARTLAGDRESGVLRLAVTRSATRTAVVLARALLALPMVCAMVLVTGLAAYATARGFHDFGPLLEDGYELFSAEELRQELTLAVGACLFPMLATHAFGMLVSALARNATFAVASAVSLFLAFDLFKEALGDAQYLVFAAFVPSFIDGSAMKEMSGLARGFSDAGFSADLAERNWIVPGPEGLLFVVAACWLHARRAH